MINPALLKALIPQDVMDNVQNAAQAFIEMREDIRELKLMVRILYDCNPTLADRLLKEKDGTWPKQNELVGLPANNGNGTE